jgi:hypothetical protein
MIVEIFDLFSGIGFVESWKRGKKESVLANHRFCGQKGEGDCRFRQKDIRKRKLTEREALIPWRLTKGKGESKKIVQTSGNFCPTIT